MIPALLFLVIFAGLSAVLERLSHSRVHSGALLASCLIILSHYLVGLCGLPLVVASYALIAAGVGGIIWLGISSRGRDALTFSTAVIVFAGLALHLLLADAYMYWWDDFSHWGVMAKELFYRGSFAQDYTDTTVVFTDYPPGTAVFYFFVTQFTGYSEGALFFAHSILFLAISLALIPRRKQVIGVETLVIIGAWLSFCLNADAYRSLFVDGFLGGFFGAALVLFYAERADKAKAIRMVAPLLFTLPVIKLSGFSFVLFLAGFLACALLRSAQQNEDLRHARENKRHLLGLLGVVAGAWLLRHGWKLWIGDMPNPMARRAYSFATLLDDIGTPELTEKYTKTLENFWEKVPALFWTDGGILLLSTAVLSLVLAAFSGRPALRRIALVQLGIALGYVAYALGLLMLYLTSFSTFESIVLASHERYLLTYFVGWSLLSLHLSATMLTPLLQQRVWLRRATPVIALVSLGWLFYWLPSPKHEPDERRQQIRDEKAQIQPYLDAGKRVYILWEGYDALDCFKANYEYVPEYRNTWENCSAQEKPYPQKQVLPEYADEILTEMPFNEEGKEPVQKAHDYLFFPRGDAHSSPIIGRFFAPLKMNEKTHIFYRKNGIFYPVLD